MNNSKKKTSLKIYENRKTILFSSILIFVLGIFVAFFNWGTEPHETLGGFFCGIGLGFSILALSLKKPID